MAGGGLQEKGWKGLVVAVVVPRSLPSKLAIDRGLTRLNSPSSVVARLGRTASGPPTHV